MSLCVHAIFCVSFLAESRSRISSLVMGASRLNSGNFDRISLPNIKKNDATLVVIWGVHLCAVKSLWSSCHHLFLQFGLLGSLSTKCGFDVLPFYSPGTPEGELFGVLSRFPQGKLSELLWNELYNSALATHLQCWFFVVYRWSQRLTSGESTVPKDWKALISVNICIPAAFDLFLVQNSFQKCTC